MITLTLCLHLAAHNKQSLHCCDDSRSLDPIFERSKCNMLQSVYRRQQFNAASVAAVLHLFWVLKGTARKFSSDSFISDLATQKELRLVYPTAETQIHVVCINLNPYRQLSHYPKDNIVYPGEICSSTCYCTHSLPETNSCLLAGPNKLLRSYAGSLVVAALLPPPAELQ